jgi:hypothetical protein
LTDKKKTPKPKSDVTRTARAGAYLERLDAAKGKRVVVDLDASTREALEGLLGAGYAENQSGVIRKAILAASKLNFKST